MIPEPSTAALFAISILILVLNRRPLPSRIEAKFQLQRVSPSDANFDDPVWRFGGLRVLKAFAVDGLAVVCAEQLIRDGKLKGPAALSSS